MEEKIIVSTCVGDIVVYPNADPTHPGISIMLRQRKTGYEIDLVYIESCEDPACLDYDPDGLYIHCYEDVYSENSTHSFRINRKSFNRALGG